MTGPDLSATLSRLGISQAEAARLLGVTPTAVTRWVQGKRAVPGPVVRLLALMALQIDEPQPHVSIKETLFLWNLPP